MRTLKELAQEAITVQDACNPLGVANSYGSAMSDLYDALHAAGLPNDTKSICAHSIARLWASKIHDLAGMGFSDSDRFGKAYQECKKLAASD